MVRGLRVLAVVLLTLCIAYPASADNLFPWQTGDWAEYDVYDSRGNTWTSRMEILDPVTINSKIYTHARFSGWDPHSTVPEDLIRDIYGRFTPTAIYVPFNEPPLTVDGEALWFQAAVVGTKWEVPPPSGNSAEVNQYKEIVAIEEVIVPYGTFTAYKQHDYFIWKNDLAKTKITLSYEWLVPDNPALGRVMVETYATNREDSEPHIWKLAAVHHVAPVGSTFLLFGSGLGILAIVCRRKLTNKN